MAEEPSKNALPGHQTAKPPKRPLREPFNIPSGACVIDVDMIETEAPSTSLFGDGRLLSPIVKLEPGVSASESTSMGDLENHAAMSKQASDQAAIIPESTVKEEPMEFPGFSYWSDVGQSTANPIEITDGDEDLLAGTMPGFPPISIGDNMPDLDDDCMDIDETAEVPTPPEQSSQEQFRVQNSIENRSSDLPEPRNSTQPSVAAPLPPLDLGTSKLIKRVHVQRDDQSGSGPPLDFHEKMKAAQKLLAQKVRGGQLNHPRRQGDIQGGPTARTPHATRPQPSAEDDEWELPEDNDEDGFIVFQTYEREYKKKRAQGKATWTDDVEFMKRQTAYQSQKNRADLEEARIAGPKPRQQSEASDDVFVHSEEHGDKTPPVASSLKRMRDELGESEIDEESGLDNDADDAPEPSSRKSSSKKGQAAKRASRKGPSKKDERISMSAGIEVGLAREERKNKRRKSKEQTSQSGGSSKGSKSKRGRPKGSQSQIIRKPRQPKSTGPVVPTGHKQRLQLMKDFTSFSNSNIYLDANENLSKGGLPELTRGNKAEALKALIASVPEEDRRSANLDKRQILDASKMLGHSRGLCRTDGKGGWALKGFNGSLKHHQVLGAAWMLERETQTAGEPYGGLCADEMGFGKTIMMIANMIANKAPADQRCKTTLIVATPGLVTQWMNEITTFALPDAIPIVVRYSRENQYSGPGASKLLQNADVILTTYQMVLKSYPKYEPPAEIVSPQEKQEWWKDHYAQNRGFFHSTKFYRIVIDEAQYIKNHQARTSVACRGLMGKYRWAMSGTPIHNSIEELYPYFKFLHVKHTGSLDTFKENFCSKGSEISNARLHGFLRMFMMRRTHKDTIFNQPIIKLPKNHQTTIEIEFNAVERKIYDVVKERFWKRIENWYRSGGQQNLQKNYSNILVMLMRLRQLTSHIFLAQSTIEELFELEDIEALWAVTEKETKADNPDKAIVDRMRLLISAARTKANSNSTESAGKWSMKEKSKDTATTETRFSVDDMKGEMEGPSMNARSKRSIEQMEEEAKGAPGLLTFKFRKFLREMRNSSNWSEIAKRSVCHRCEDVPDEPHVTDCFHIYCYECLEVLGQEAAEQGHDAASCLACGRTYKETKPCPGLQALDRGKADADKETQSEPFEKRRYRSSRSSSTEEDKSTEESMAWIMKDGEILPSSKLTMVALAVETWLKEDPAKKIIIFTQWRLMYGHHLRASK
ncbi:MAG: hypothetical protein Q9165_005771 [Trypethelium subeluteriae]